MLEEFLLVWRNPFSRQGEYSWINQQQEIVRESFPGSVSTESLLETVQHKVSRDLNWRWLKLELDGATIGYVGIDDAIEIEVPASWLSISARLLATALTWEWNQTEQKLTALGEYAAGAGHEINNPLAAIKGRSAQLLQSETDPHRRQLLETIGSQTYRIRDMIGDSMLFAHPPPLQLATLNLAQLIETVVQQFVDEFRRRKISLWGNRESEISLEGDESQICVVVAELIRNSLNAVDDGGRIEIDCYQEDDEINSAVILRIADNGCGMTSEQKIHCFDPFYSGREAGRGLGFGLTKCWRIVREHHGTLAVADSNPGMTEFLIRFPLKKEAN